jgi:hypothetical protein
LGSGGNESEDCGFEEFSLNEESVPNPIKENNICMAFCRTFGGTAIDSFVEPDIYTD